MGSACSSPPPPEQPKSLVPISPHTPEEVNKITPLNVPSEKALLRLFKDYDLDGYVARATIVSVPKANLHASQRPLRMQVPFYSHNVDFGDQLSHTLGSPLSPPALYLSLTHTHARTRTRATLLPRRNGHIEVGELGQMISELKKATGVSQPEDEAKVESDAQCVMEILDSDGNGTLEADEFVKWVTTGLSRSQEERNEVASMSQINRRMDNFLTSVSIMADELQKIGDV
eukprot:g1454.t1